MLSFPPPVTRSLPMHPVRLLALVLFAQVLTPADGSALPSLKLFVRDAGVYGVGFEDLVAAGLPAEEVPSAGLGLRYRDGWQPLWVEDGGDGRFGPGDRVEFVAERLAGEHGYSNDYTPFNVYRLELEADGAPRVAATEAAAGTCAAVEPRAVRHFEQDVLRVRFRVARGEREPEVWYWHRITWLDDQTFEMDLDLSDLDADAGRPVLLRLGLKGWSEMGRGQEEHDDHTVVVEWDGHTVSRASWDNRPYGLALEVAEFPADLVEPGSHHLVVRVPQRSDEQGRGLVDVVLVNWVEVEYAVATDRTADQDRLSWETGAAPVPCARLDKRPETRLVAFDETGRRVTAGVASAALTLPQDDAPGRAWILVDDHYLEPARIEVDEPSDWGRLDRQADYLMITHPSLAEAIQPLAEFHRRRGLTVEVVDVTDVYDEFAWGVETPVAIREFLRTAWEGWQRPAPRFVLLVGDASWDTKNTVVDDENYADWSFRHGRIRDAGRFPKNESTPYENQGQLNVRNLVPTWAYPTFQGHAASDTAFVTFDPEQPDLPVMAIGRLPVVEPDEVRAIVDKTIRYAEEAPVGPWKARALFITNQESVYQRMSDDLAWEVSEEGLGWSKIYPASKETSNELHTARLIEALDEGQLVVHFVGHGGRYIWRTGPPDYRKNHDLFTLDDVERLAPTDRPSVVVSMSCYSAPFDHPNADSIGEKFLRLADRGAVGVIAASWRNVPNRTASTALLRHLARKGTLGEALMIAKGEVTDASFRAQYNLLGDPALEIAAPSMELAVTAAGPERVTVTVPAEAFTGQAIVEWTDELGGTLGQATVPVQGLEFEAVPDGPLAGEPALVRVYAWDEERRIDGVGSVLLAGPEAEAAIADDAREAPKGESRP